MRRLAKQTRKDSVRSRRDYQEIQEVPSLLVNLGPRADTAILRFVAPDLERASGIACVGGYLKTRRACDVEIRLTTAGGTTSERFQAGRHWTRVGVMCPAVRGKLVIELVLPTEAGDLCLWGLDAGAVRQPDGLKMDVALLGSPHLVPETFYLAHNTSAVRPTGGWKNAVVANGAGDTIPLKKCAYCQRLLPIDPKRPATLAFHKHNAKRTGHQNECRACKKWRINDDFNPKRTVDQLHESSVITRERKLFLREPEVLYAIKDRQGAGLKSIVWNRFGRKCFRCKTTLALGEVELDHTRPMAYLWPIDEHATCLCATCNNHKKDRFPVDVYTEPQLRELSKLTGLSYAELIRKDVCEEELQRILLDIVGFARTWDPSMFNATARKVRELRRIDLFEVLRKANAREYARMLEEIAKRPEPVI